MLSFQIILSKLKQQIFAGVVKSLSADEKYVVKFDDDFERILKLEDLIRVDALLPGHQVGFFVHNVKTSRGK